MEKTLVYPTMVDASCINESETFSINNIFHSNYSEEMSNQNTIECKST